MNKKIRNIIILFAILAGGIAASVIIYNSLSHRYIPEEFSFEGETVAAGINNDTNEVIESKEDQPEDKKNMATNFSMINFEGETVSLSDFFGKPVIMNFWATWCPPCLSEMQDFDKMYEKNGDIINYIMVNLTDGYRDTEESVHEFIKYYGYKFPVFFDTKQSGSLGYGIVNIPTTVFINADGTINEVHIGAMNADTLQKYIDRLEF